MDEEETATEPHPKLSKKELRKQQLMEYLAAKGKLKPPNPKPYLRDGQLEAKKPAMSTVKPDSAKSKENRPPNAANKRNDAQKVQPQSSKGASMQLDMGIKPPVRPSSSKSLSNIPQQTTSQPKYRASWPTGEAKSAPQMTCSSRMSLGPLAKTRTSLIPSILQPRTTIPTATTTTSSTANREHSNNTTRLVSTVAQKSTVARGKPFSFTDVLKHTRTTATGASVADIKTKTLNKTISKPPPVKSLKPSLQNRPPTAFKAASTRSPAAVVKPHQNERAPKSIKSVQGGTGNAQPQKVSSGGFSGAGGQRQTTASNRTTPTAGLKAKDEVHRGADNKSAIDSTKESQQNQPPTPTAFKATCVSTRPTTAPAKPEQKARVPEYAKSVQPSKKASERRSGVEGTGNNPRSQKVGSGGTSDAEGQRQNTVSKRATHTAELTEKDRVHGGASNNKREECTSSKRAGVPYVPQAVPQRATSLSSVEWFTDTKTQRAQATVMPQTEKQNLTAAQEDRMQKFREWRESKGISYKRPPMHERPPPVRRTTVAVPQDDDDTRALICALDHCVKLMEEPLDKLRDVFDILEKRDEIQGAAGGTSEAGCQRQNRVSKRATHTAELTEKDRVHGGASNNKREECTSSKRAGVPYVAKSLSSVEWFTDTKTPRAQATVMPQTEKQNLTAAQEDRMQKFREWRESKGISYKRPPMHEMPPPVRRTVAVPQPNWTNKNDDDDTRALICALDHCVKLMEEPLDKLRDVFDILEKRDEIQGSAGGTSEAGCQRQNRVSKRATHTAELTEKDRVHGGASNNKREECTSSKRAGVPYVAKSLSSVEWFTDTKTQRAQATVMPQTEKQNLTAAQEDRMQKFREWRESKGISYKRPPMHERPPPVRRTTVAVPQDDDDTRALICALDHCVKLMEEPLDKLRDVFDILEKRDEIQGAAGGTSEAGCQRQNRVSKRATHTAELTEKDRVHGGASNNKREECTSSKRAGVPYVAKSLSSVEWFTDTKTPRAQATVMPQTEKQNLTAAQEDRMQKLREWRESKGISYKRPPMHERPPPLPVGPDWTNKNDDDYHRALICALDYCVKLMDEPLHKLRDMFDILKKRVDIQGRACTPQELQEDSPIQGQNCSEAAVTPAFTPNPVRACVYSEKSSSSMVKYKVTSTPFPSHKQREPVRVNGQELRFITPVRRSVRIEGASLRYPASLRDHDVCVASYDDLMVQEEQEEDREASSPSIHGTPMYVYVENQALKDKVDVQLFTNDED